MKHPHENILGSVYYIGILGTHGEGKSSFADTLEEILAGTSFTVSPEEGGEGLDVTLNVIRVSFADTLRAGFHRVSGHHPAKEKSHPFERQALVYMGESARRQDRNRLLRDFFERVDTAMDYTKFNVVLIDDLYHINEAGLMDTIIRVNPHDVLALRERMDLADPIMEGLKKALEGQEHFALAQLQTLDLLTTPDTYLPATQHIVDLFSPEPRFLNNPVTAAAVTNTIKWAFRQKHSHDVAYGASPAARHYIDTEQLWEAHAQPMLNHLNKSIDELLNRLDQGLIGEEDEEYEAALAAQEKRADGTLQESFLRGIAGKTLKEFHPPRGDTFPNAVKVMRDRAKFLVPYLEQMGQPDDEDLQAFRSSVSDIFGTDHDQEGCTGDPDNCPVCGNTEEAAILRELTEKATDLPDDIELPQEIKDLIAKLQAEGNEVAVHGIKVQDVGPELLERMRKSPNFTEITPPEDGQSDKN